jgi:hypothetical protein
MSDEIRMDGTAMDRPIPCHMPIGERQYLGRLRCPQGHKFNCHRMGSMNSPYMPNPVDTYRIFCTGGECGMDLHFDMYQEGHGEQLTPPGYTLAPIEGGAM